MTVVLRVVDFYTIFYTFTTLPWRRYRSFTICIYIEHEYVWYERGADALTFSLWRYVSHYIYLYYMHKLPSPSFCIRHGGIIIWTTNVVYRRREDTQVDNIITECIFYAVLYVPCVMVDFYDCVKHLFFMCVFRLGDYSGIIPKWIWIQP